MSTNTIKEEKKGGNPLQGSAPIPEGYALFTYKAIDSKGKRITGKIAARSHRDAIKELESKSYKILSLEKPAQQRVRTSALSMSLFDLMLFFRELSLICSSGLLIQRGIYVLGEQSQEAHVKGILLGLRKALEGGKTFSDALGLYPESFTTIHKYVIKSAEASGTMDQCLDYLAKVTEKEMILKRRVRTALNYPAVIFTIGILGFIFTLGLIRPYLQTLITSLNIQLPLYTKIMMAIAGALGKFQFIIPAIIVAAFTAPRLVRFVKTSTLGKMFWDTIIMAIPFIKEIRKKALIIDVFLILISLLRAGVQLTAALKLAADTCDSPIMQKALRDVVGRIEEGGGFAENLSIHHSIFPHGLVAMVAVGEECGDLPGVLEKIVFLYDVELENTIDTFMKLIEPLAIAVLGVMAAIVLLSFFIPIYLSINNI